MSVKRTILRLLTPILLIGFMIVSLYMPLQKANALTGNDFNPGRIIDDVVFTNSSSMTVSNISDFIAAKMSTCDTNGTTQKSYYYNSSTGEVNVKAGSTWVTTSRLTYGQHYATFWNSHTVDSAGNKRSGNYITNESVGPYVCLKNYVENPSTGANNLQNPSASISGGQSAAQIIATAATTYNINPQVLLVTLQKEQGLLSDDWPWTNEYAHAMGYNCTDSAPCSGYTGFYQQINAAAKQFRRYLDYPNNYNYVVGTQSVPYSPTCSGPQITIQNQATAALYDYTPYQPDPNVIAATNDTGSTSGPGGTVSGDSCGAYGNRNFWWYFNSWFGSTLAPDYSWQPLSQYAYTDSTKTTAIGLNNLTPDQRVYVGFTVKNLGNMTWTNSGSNPVRVGTLRSLGRDSSFADPTWLGLNRPANMIESSVAPGQTATFEFWITAPEASQTNYSEYFGLLTEGKAWMPDMGLYYNISVQPPRYSYQLTSQYAFTDDTKTTATGLGNMEPGQRKFVGFTAKNTGNVTWTNTGKNPLDVGTTHSLDRQSMFYDASWISPSRPTRMKESSVAPGQTATFEFWTKAPTSWSGNFNEYFDPVLEGKAWLGDIGMNFAGNVVKPQYSWQLTSQYAYTDSTKTTGIGLDSLAPNQKIFIGFTAKNTSNVTWHNDGSNPVDIGTTNPTDRMSQLCGTNLGWLGCNRPVRMKEASVAPGQTATFEFTAQAPSSPGNYREYFNPVAEGIAWMPYIGFNYYITVK